MKLRDIKDRTNEWAAVLPFCNRVFQKQELNACCRNREFVKDINATSRLSLAAILESVRSDALRERDTFSWTLRPLDELAGYILEYLHRPLGVHLTNAGTLIEMIEESHGDAHAETILQLRKAFENFRREMENHLSLEEDVLFPWIISDGVHWAHELVSTLRHQHARLSQKVRSVITPAVRLAELRGGCEGCRALCTTLKRLETLLLDQIHFENNLLFPRAFPPPSVSI